MEAPEFGDVQESQRLLFSLSHERGRHFKSFIVTFLFFTVGKKNSIRRNSVKERTFSSSGEQPGNPSVSKENGHFFCHVKIPEPSCFPISFCFYLFIYLFCFSHCVSPAVFRFWFLEMKSLTCHLSSSVFSVSKASFSSSVSFWLSSAFAL